MKKSALTLSHMSLSSRSCALPRLTNIVSFVAKIYLRLPLRINIIIMCYATTGKAHDNLDKKIIANTVVLLCELHMFQSKVNDI